MATKKTITPNIEKATEAPKKAVAKKAEKKNIEVDTDSSSDVKAKATKAKATKADTPEVEDTKPKTGKGNVTRRSKKVTDPVDENQTAVMIDYNPTTRSVLDTVDQPSGPVYRYSDEDLNEFRELIYKRIASARENLVYYQNLMTRKDGGGDDADNRLNSMEDGSGALEKEQLAQMAARQVQFINHLEKALMRIENKTYGICRVTGKLIDKNRLKAVPHATLSMEAKLSNK